jgi:hypothetical protein
MKAFDAYTKAQIPQRALRSGVFPDTDIEVSAAR